MPINGTIFFAGEGLYEGVSPGTVEAALISGKEAAAKITGR
jgi:monoamine oxidase